MEGHVLGMDEDGEREDGGKGERRDGVKGIVDAYF